MFIFVVPTLQKKWNEICMKELAGGKCMENDCFLRTLKFEMIARRPLKYWFLNVMVMLFSTLFILYSMDFI
jgi:hypothetical protein